jgi:heme exporter protein B
MSGPRVALLVLQKDLLLEFRTRDRLGHMAVFAALVVVLLSIALEGVRARHPAFLPTLAWVVFLFSSLLGLGRSFSAEVEHGADALLAQVPCDRGWIFLGKAGANLIALLGVQALTGLLFAVFLEARWESAPAPIAAASLLGSIGLSSIGTLLAAMAVSARFREFLLPILLFPFMLPVLVLASRISAEALAGSAAPAAWWGALALYDWVFLLIGYFCFDYLLED